jgi:3-(3-hydroxy-phenyl)propionate hydroxylase
LNAVSTPEVDVIVVGYGPSGLVLASLLGQLGHSVAVVERWPNLYGKPRLTHIDGETARLVSVCGDADQALRDSWTVPHYYFFNGKNQLLLDVGASGNTRRMLWDDHISVHLPHIEEAIHEKISSLPNVHLYRGYTANGLVQDAEGVTLRCVPWHKGDGTSDSPASGLTLRARYVVGCDGSNSFVRDALGVERIDFGFNERWLCVDTQPLRPLPSKFDENAIQICDPRRGHMFMPIGKKRQRFEFALLPNETTEEMQSVEAAYHMLRHYHGLGPEDVSLIRNLVYTFECRLAKTWKVNRVFLAGDAAHTNPPYLGQGACSGMRDGANLAWKFHLVLRGLCDAELLESYERERRPHAQRIMVDSRSLGLVANTSNPVKAAMRDLLFKLNLAPKPKFPVLTDGVLARTDHGKPLCHAGTLAPQGRVTVDGTTMRFDEHVGFGFALITRPGIVGKVSPEIRAALKLIGVRVVELRAASDRQGVIDADGVYGRFLDTLKADAVLTRPDFVVYGHAVRSDLEQLLERFLEQLRFTGRGMPATT